MSAYNDFIYLLGDLFALSFEILPVLGNLPNYLFALLMAVGAIYWLNMQSNYSKEAREKGTIE